MIAVNVPDQRDTHWPLRTDWMRSFASDLLEILPLLLAIGFTVWLNYQAAVTDIATDTLLLWIVNILLLLALAGVVQRYTSIRSLSNRIDRLAVPAVDARPFLLDRNQFPSFSDRARRTHTISFFGTSLEVVTGYLYGDLVDKVEAGGELRFVLVDPDSVAAEARSYGLFNIHSADQLKDDIRRTIARIDGLRDKAEHANAVQLRLTKHVPGYSLVGFDMTSDDGEIAVELYPYEVSGRHRPHFELRPGDRPWFAFFREQYEAIWDHASDYFSP